MNSLGSLVRASCAVLACAPFAVACSSASSGSSTSADSPSGSEVAVSAVSGALSNTSGSGVAYYRPAPKSSFGHRALHFLNPIGTAYGATWTCSDSGLSPAFKGPGDYSFTPPSCSVTWLDDKTATSSWSGPFALDYGSSCDDAHVVMEKQTDGCELTRTSSASGETRTITGPNGNTYAIDHDTNGAGTGWDSSVSPAPSDDGVLTTCGSGGCSATRTLVISGSHLAGTVTIDGDALKIWDHTVSTSSEGLTVTGAAGDRVVSGEVTVQHNLLKYTSTTTFSSVGYGDVACCFPTRGEVSTTFSKGADVGKTETLSFTGVCGEATLKLANGTTAALTLLHCL